MMIFSIALWGTLLYIWAKSVLAQLVFFTLTIWVIAITLLAFSSGREVCEAKLVDRIKNQKLADGSILPEQADEIELPSEEKSHLWKKALIFYSVASPLILAVPCMFLIFGDSMFAGQVCKFYELAGNSQEYCLANYASAPETFIEAAGFRYQGLIAALFGPIIMLTLEFFQNQLLISWKHIVYQYMFTGFYAGTTAIW